jgi:hypothetical protein
VVINTVLPLREPLLDRRQKLDARSRSGVLRISID